MLSRAVQDRRGDGYRVVGSSEVFSSFEDAIDFRAKANLTGSLQTEDLGWYQRVYEGAKDRYSLHRHLYMQYDCYQSVLTVSGLCGLWAVCGIIGAYAAGRDSNCFRIAVRER